MSGLGRFRKSGYAKKSNMLRLFLVVSSTIVLEMMNDITMANILFIQTGDVANATKYIVSYSQTLNELGKSVSKEFPKGTLTMTIAANVGDVAILNFDAYFPDSVVGFVPNKNIRTLYLFYVFSAMKDEFIRTAIKSTQLNLNIDRVKETFIPVTLNVNEQCEIENYLRANALRSTD